MVEVKVFRADLDTDECMRYIDGHKKVLEAYGVTQVTSADLSWMEEPFSYIIIVKDKSNDEVLGGGRIQVAGGSLPLPIEKAIDKLDPRIFDFVKEKALDGTGEYCGLWNSKKIAGYGVGSKILMWVGASVIDQLKLGSLFAFCSPATRKRVMNSGFQIITSLGNEGTFYYPKEDLLATALLLTDPLKFEYAHPEERNEILNLRRHPLQKNTYKGPKGEMKIEFNLKIKSMLPNEVEVGNKVIR